MRKLALCLAVFAIAVGGTIVPELEEVLSSARPDEMVDVVVQTRLQADLAQLPPNTSYDEKVSYLQYVAGDAQRDILAWLETTGAENVKPFWLVSRVALSATPEVIRELAARPDVEYVIDDFVETVGPVSESPAAAPDQLQQWNINIVKAPECWAEGYDGTGIVVGNLDTGVLVTHEALAGRWRATNGWFDGVNGQSTPYDDNNHGTHCMGSSVGTHGIGVAPGATFIAAKGFSSGGSGQQSWIMACLDWFADHGRPDVLSNSWGGARTNEYWFAPFQNLRTLGIVVVVSIGNSGPGGSTSNSPGNYPISIGVGATNNSDVIASFSSRGPAPNQSPWNNSQYWSRPDWNLINPVVSAPGVDVRSAMRNGGYGLMSGTSMAGPHVAGAAAILLQKNPVLDHDEVFNLLADHADRPSHGAPYPNNNYGWGRINVKSSLDNVGDPTGPANLRMTLVNVVDPPPGGNGNGRFDPGETADIVLTLRNIGGETAGNVTAVLRSGHPQFTISDPNGAFGNIAPGEGQTNASDPFTATASGAMPRNTPVPCTLHVQWDGGGTWMHVFTLTVGAPPSLSIVWGPRALPSFPSSGFPYGMAYNPVDNRLYVTNLYSRQIYMYSSDQNLSYIGTIPAPDTLLTDLAYSPSDNTFWVAANFTSAGRRVYKITPTGTVLRQFNNPANDYPTGVAWFEPERELYFSDRRTAMNTFPQYVYAADTTGTTRRRMNVPLQANYGPRGLDVEPSGPEGGSLLLIYTAFNSGGTAIDSVGLYELKRSDLEIVQRLILPGWNARGVAYDPRDGNYWISLVESPDNSVVKIEGLYGPPTGVAEPSPVPVADRLELLSVSPNPSPGPVRLSYNLPVAGHVRVSVCDLAGRVVAVLADDLQEPGLRNLTWNGRTDDGARLAGGIYFFRLEGPGGSQVGRFVLMH